MRNDLSERTRELALTLTSWPSVTGTLHEATFAGKLAEHLRSFDKVWCEPVAKADGDRSNVYALKRGRSKRTIVLTGHFDTVPYTDYNDLEELALAPDKLTPALIKRLKATGDSPLALEDLSSGMFLPGRGLLDMKAGLAAGLAAIESYQGSVSLLFIAVCDEEERSAGARAAAPRLQMIASEFDLEIAMIINLDAVSDQGNGALGRVVALGSVGKLLLTAFVVGRESHACHPQDGVNAAYLAAELVAEFELASELAEKSGTEIAAPPTALHLKDQKSGYNVTTPAQAWVYWNTLQHQRTAADVMATGLQLARRAMLRVRSKLGRDVPVMTYAELAVNASREAFEEAAGEVAKLTSIDLPERAKLLTAYVWRRSGLQGPAVVLGFGSIPYPAVRLRNESLEPRIINAIKPFGLSSVQYFPGISDMSFFGEASGDLSAAAANTPIWGSCFAMSESAQYPCINIGPWGRDYHHWLERMHVGYGFETLPRVLLAVIDALAEAG